MSASGSTHEQAVVLVGNYHQDDENLSSYTAKGLTIMSIDADNNQEPDYAWYSNNTQDRPAIPPTRFDFVALIPVGMSSRVNNSTFYPGIPIWKPRGWFEMTETSLSRMDQFELNSNNFNANVDTRYYRCIINGGYFTQMVRSRKAACNKVKYYQIGGNAYVKEFYPGSHSADNYGTILCPINVTGGEIEQCFMTGYGKGTAIGSDIYFWCAGGKIDKFLGAYMEKPKQTSDSDGNVNMTAKIDHAKIGRFFGGGTSPKAQISGNIDVTINNSTVDFYCGGPEFGDMTSGKTVTTRANNTTFGEYYGAGFGGTAITYTNDEDYNGQGLGGASTPTVTYPSNFFTSHYVAQRLKNTNNGIGNCYKFEFIFNSRGAGSVARFYTGYAKFSLATTGSVTNILEGCTMLGNFYGAGCQGKVSGTVTSTLTGCTINGSAFGGGYKAENNIVDVYPTTEPGLSVYTRETGIFSDFGTVAPVQFVWKQNESGHAAGTSVDAGNSGTLYTDVILSDLGNVTGAISITVDGGTVAESVYGGGNESKSLNNTSVTLTGNATVSGNVFGGGNLAPVGGSVTVEMSGGTVNKDVYGGGALANTNINNATNYGTASESISSTSTNTTTVNLTGGTIKGDAYGGGLGQKDGFYGKTGDIAAVVYGDINVNLGSDGGSTATAFHISNYSGDHSGVVKSGRVFGCNNLLGSPQGDVRVTVYKTVAGNVSRTAHEQNNEQRPQTGSGVTPTYEVAAVYGGGNLANYTTTGKKAYVKIMKCDVSIRSVYGGGNAAAVPETDVLVNGAYEIAEVFGGGNGKDSYTTDDAGTNWVTNPGADVYSNATTLLRGGYIHEAYGGSNSKGTISGNVSIDKSSGGDCTLTVEDLYGAGKDADIEGDLIMVMGCSQTRTENIYGCSMNANVK